MSTYWAGYAPNYSREVEAAHEAVKVAEDRLRASLKASYPLGALVRVVHQRSGGMYSFYGNVAGWDRHGSRERP